MSDAVAEVRGLRADLNALTAGLHRLMGVLAAQGAKLDRILEVLTPDAAQDGDLVPELLRQMTAVLEAQLVLTEAVEGLREDLRTS